MSSETAAENKYCSNCKKDIAAANFTMHEVHCRRHLVLCEHCKEPVPRTEMEQHFTDVHAKVACSQCALELEKDQLDTHMERECPKRQVSCEYCELEVPQCDLASHLEFCSTRTEACPRCGNFVMHKDLLRHNSSNCTYPEVKPPASHANGAPRMGGGENFNFDARHNFFGYGELDDSFDPFEFEEIRRALEGDADGGGMQSLPVEDSDASAAAGEQRSGGREKRQGARGGRTSVPRLADQKKNDTQRGGRKVATNRRSDVNRQRNQESPPPIPPDMDYDTMLALQLASEDQEEGRGDLDPDPDAHLNELINSYENRSLHSQRHRPSPLEVEDVSVPASPPPAYEEYSGADEVMIPCEFCGETFPAFALVHHQSVCDPLASGLWGSGQDSHVPAFGQNNDQRRPPASRPPTIPVINNLGSASPAQESGEERGRHLSDNGDHLSGLESLEMTMLPCEFCYELLPADSLVQHQAMCEGKPATPQVTTPAAAQPSSAFSRNQRNFFPTSTSTSGTRRQQTFDPTGELLAVINQGAQGSGSGNVRPKKRPNAPRGNNTRNRASPSQPIAASTDPPEEEDFSIHGRRGSRQNQGRRDSANRTRHTLNSLLADEGSDNTGPARSGNREGGGQNRQGLGSRRRGANNGSGGDPPLATGVSSRTVQMQMQQQDRRQRARGNNAGEGDGNTPGSRRGQRERGDHVFNSTANARSQANPNRHRRSSDRQMPEWE